MIHLYAGDSQVKLYAKFTSNCLNHLQHLAQRRQSLTVELFVEDTGDLILCNNKLKGALSRGYCCFRSILTWRHLLAPSSMHKIPARLELSKTKKVSNEFYQGGATPDTRCRHRMKVGRTFAGFNPCPFLQSTSTDHRKQF